MIAMSPPNLTSLFLLFGSAYLLSSSLRGITAALSPYFVQEFNLTPNELGLLGGAYFFGFAFMQLPMGAWLDRFGPKRVMAVSLVMAVIGSQLFSAAQSMPELLAARFLCGAGVSACLIAPLTAARLWLNPSQQQQINLWMLMAGAFGLLVATLPAQSAATIVGWRIMFSLVALLFIAIIVAIVIWVPQANVSAKSSVQWFLSYGEIIKSRHIWKIGPLGFFNYAILVAVQTLWAGPWFTNVVLLSADDAATGLFWMNLIMLFVFMALGFFSAKIIKSKRGAEGALKIVLPLSLLSLLCIPIMGKEASWPYFAAYCVASSVLALTHPFVGQHFESHQAGRAIAFFNFLLFLGVFVAQWGVGLIIAVIKQGVHHLTVAYQVSFYILFFFSCMSYLWFLFFENIPGIKRRSLKGEALH